MAGNAQQDQDIDPVAARAIPPQPVRAPRATLLASALAIGIAAGWFQPQPLVWPWLGAAIAILACGLVIPARAHGLVMVLLCGSIAALGAGWVTLRQHYITANDLARMAGDEAALIQLEGEALGPPVLRSRTAGSMAKFDYRTPATYFPLRVKALLGRDGARVPVTGGVFVRVDESVVPFRAGDQVIVRGLLMRPMSPRNPGEFDYQKYARSLGQAGLLTIASRDLLTVTPAERSTASATILNWREILRRRASAWLLTDLPQTERPDRNSLLLNLLLGERDAQIDEMYGLFQRVGLAHILAISGFHLSVLAGFVMVVARLLGGYRRWHGWLIIGVVGLYLMLIEVHMPVLRAAVMTCAACLGMVYGRRLQVSGLVSLSAILLLLWRPDQLFNAGFQLTYGVVLGLIHLTPPLRRQLFGQSDLTASTSGEMLGQWMRTAIAGALVGWAVATPIVIYHFGMVSPLGAPLSVIAIPLSGLILVIGYLKMILSAVLPSAALILGFPLSVSADVLLAIVSAIDAMPLAAAHVPYPHASWSIAALAWVCCAAIGPARWSRRWLAWISLSVLGLAAWLYWPVVSQRAAAPPLRIDMLSVGDGSCYIVRTRTSTVMFDAGSSSDLNVGRRSLVPAMRHLGVRSIDAVAVSHADLDHYSAVIELADEFSIDEVFVTPQFMAEAKSIGLGPAAHLIEELTRRRVTVREVGAGHARDFGVAHWRWLAPEPDRLYAKANDGSMVVRIESAGRGVLLCGDIERQGMESVMADPDSIDADIVEIPHHGRHHETAETFMAQVSPRIAMQSTGWNRWQRDQWTGQLAGIERLVTARDGACWVIIQPDGRIETGRFLKSVEHP